MTLVYSDWHFFIFLRLIFKPNCDISNLARLRRFIDDLLIIYILKKPGEHLKYFKLSFARGFMFSST